MKKIILGLVIILSVDIVSFSQIKITKATKQKTIAETAGVYMNYSIEYENKKNIVIEIDSVKTISDASAVSFYSEKNKISFQEVLLPPAKCKTCVETTSVQKNLTQGIIIYYRKGEGKSTCKVKKFKQLSDIIKP